MTGVFLKAKKEHYFEAGNWLAYTAGFGALPFWAFPLLCWLFSRKVSSAMFTDNAALIVYSAGLLASAIPVMRRGGSGASRAHPSWFQAVAEMVLVVSSLVFAAVASGLGFGPIAVPNQPRLLLLSAIIAIISIALAFATELIEQVRLDPDVRAIADSQYDSLADAVARQRKEL